MKYTLPNGKNVNIPDKEIEKNMRNINEEDFIHIEEIMENAKELSKRVPYNKLVNNTYAKKE